MTTVNPRRIYQARLAAGMSQGDLAHAIRGLTPFKTTDRNVRTWEKGGSVPRGDVVAAIAQATGTEISFLYGADASDDDEEEAALLRDLRKLPADQMPRDLLGRLETVLAKRAVGEDVEVTSR